MSFNSLCCIQLVLISYYKFHGRLGGLEKAFDCSTTVLVVLADVAYSFLIEWFAACLIPNLKESDLLF